MRLRLAGRHSAAHTLLPTLIEVALAGAAGAEIAITTIDAFDPIEKLLRLPGRRKGFARIARLDDDAVRVIGEHVAALAKVARRRKTVVDPATMPLALPTAPRTHRSSITQHAVGQHLYRAFQMAGIRRIGVTPGSLQEFGANRVYALTNRVEDAAQYLGLHSLDAARRYVDPGWQQAWAAAIRDETA